jgi:site-specific DNA-cytosine methylase
MDDKVAPLQARDYKGGKYIFCVDQGGGKSGANVTEGITPTLTCTHGGEPVVCYNGENITNPLNKTNPQLGDPCHTLTSDSRNYLVKTKPHYIVRRLTPLECERLQWYPDGWTDIGEYIDCKGKKKKSSDSARYKALGNSIALPPWKWVIKRLCSHYERDATLCSLFDGIGGFPLIWEQINGKGSCLWASEIEDFPIAVTKVRIE